MLKHAIYRAFDKKIKCGWHKWPKMYILIDLHDVIIHGTYTRNNDGRELYPGAKEVLQWLTDRKDICLILWTSSHKDAIDDILEWMDNLNIRFDYVNENPECKSNELLDTSKKIYMDLLLDDKAGFNGETDWFEIKDTLVEIGQWERTCFC